MNSIEQRLVTIDPAVQLPVALRDYFAGQALGAKTAPGLIGYEDHAPEHRAELIRRLARDCWEIADAMLAARKA